ncbi:NUDIX hydrolase [Vagococcus hydrophili]|uniref:NUDIX domain-containing protein n=1 Tax=Vagococcus hydrophili TaxID=2714947 RepID=A0A6G8ARK9_9ENTE|nr:NUDIX domain-containing protein [Vagococcus hydrophili]QIL47636.1 NUDIX domain-containing protein [Vagococcus hydrophili]
MIKVNIYELGEIEDNFLDFAVIFTRYKNKNVYVRHKERTTFEIPGGHRELNETIEACAKRELEEETGAKKYTIVAKFIYGVEKNRKEDFGQVFLAEVEEFDTQLTHEIEEVMCLKGEPEEYTYPLIQPVILTEMLKRNK